MLGGKQPAAGAQFRILRWYFMSLPMPRIVVSTPFSRVTATTDSVPSGWFKITEKLPLNESWLYQ